MVAGLLNFEELVSALFSEPQFDLVPLLVPDVVGLAVDDFILVFP